MSKDDVKVRKLSEQFSKELALVIVDTETKDFSILRNLSLMDILRRIATSNPKYSFNICINLPITNHDSWQNYLIRSEDLIIKDREGVFTKTTENPHADKNLYKNVKSQTFRGVSIE